MASNGTKKPAVESGVLDAVLAKAPRLDSADRMQIVNQAIILLEGFYVHLPLKRAMHAVDPLQRLRLLRRRLDRFDSDRAFHAEMTAIFTSVRDLHTNYLLPPPYANIVASLPFTVEACEENGKLIHIVGSVGGTMPHASFKPGVTITHWNGVPILRAVALVADRHAGGNAAARQSRGIAGLTHRPLIVAPAPDEAWVTVGYVPLTGAPREVRFVWHPLGLDDGDTASSSTGEAIGLDLETGLIQRARQKLFAPPKVQQALQVLAEGGDQALEHLQGLDSRMPDVLTAKSVTTAAGIFGYIRIRTFSVPDEAGFVGEFVRLARQLPQNGLIIDVRDNGGGLIRAGECLLQTLTPREIDPERVQFINTPQSLLLAENNPENSRVDLSEWERSMALSVETGATFSAGFPITDAASCNRIGQQYWGPVVLVTNARCYSTTDIFAAGFQDHSIGPVLGVDDNTGAGGANVWTHDLIRMLLGANGNPDQAVPGALIGPLPQGIGMRVAIRRTLRVGNMLGTELEDLGVIPDHIHRMTRRDILAGNLDLIERAGALLSELPVRQLAADATRNGASVALTLHTANVSRVDLFVDDRPTASFDVAGRETHVSAPIPAGASVLTLRGFDDGELVASTRVTL